MNPFAWVLFDSCGNARDIAAENVVDSLESAWTFFCGEDAGRLHKLHADGYRVLRCKLVEVGPA